MKMIEITIKILKSSKNKKQNYGIKMILNLTYTFMQNKNMIKLSILAQPLHTKFISLSSILSFKKDVL